ncbi:chymotrypsinogen A-like isoform X1 [Macrobrachium nipponense]
MQKPAKDAIGALRATVELPCMTNSTPYAMNLGTTVIFKSPRFPRRYPRKTDCGWNLTGTNIVVDCDQFRTQRRKYRVCFDYLSLNGIKFCGGFERRPIGFTSNGTSLSINFHSDRLWNKRGFSCQATVMPATPDEEVPTTCTCGIPNRQSRIVGGHPTGQNEYPWQVAIAWPGNNDFQDFYCGGSVINKRFVLTAAHCGVIFEDQVIVGAHSWLSPLTSGRRVNIETVIKHEQYNPETKENDIALVKLAEDLNFTDTRVAAVCLPTVGTQETYAGMKAIATGWGSLDYGTPVFPSELQEVEVDVVNNSVCLGSNGMFSVITDNMLCAGSDAGGNGTCQGDSGGPLVVETGGIFTQIGATSLGIGCGSENFYGVYTRLTSYVDWISSKVGTYGICHQ